MKMFNFCHKQTLVLTVTISCELEADKQFNDVYGFENVENDHLILSRWESEKKNIQSTLN